jgi:hypothetical protein
MAGTLLLIWLLLLACVVVTLALALVVLIDLPSNSLRLLAWAQIADGAGLATLLVTRARP